MLDPNLRVLLRERGLLHPKLLFYPSAGMSHKEILSMPYDVFILTDYTVPASFSRRERDFRKAALKQNDTLDTMRKHLTAPGIFHKEFVEIVSRVRDKSVCVEFQSSFAANQKGNYFLLRPGLAAKTEWKVWETLYADGFFGRQGMSFDYGGSSGRRDAPILLDFGSKLIMFYQLDNNIVFEKIRKAGLTVDCFVGLNDGCREGGNYECVNSEDWLRKVFDLFPAEGGLYITDHRDGVQGPLTLPHARGFLIYPASTAVRRQPGMQGWRGRRGPGMFRVKRMGTRR